MSDEERTSAIGLARYAREYFDCALAADEVVGQRTGYEVIAPAPVMYLVAHAIELALKSFLRHKDVSLKDLRSLSHNLENCWSEALDAGIDDFVSLNETELETLQLIGALHATTELRYIVTGPKTYPVFGPLEKLCKKLLDAICPEVGYSR